MQIWGLTYVENERVAATGAQFPRTIPFFQGTKPFFAGACRFPFQQKEIKRIRFELIIIDFPAKL